MSLRALDATQVAAELGKSRSWLYDNWRQLVAAKRLPPPVSEAGGLCWNAAQVYAVLDRGLTAEQRAGAAAFRAALAAALASRSDIANDDAVAEARQRLASKFAHSPPIGTGGE